MKIAVLTAISGGYDTLKSQPNFDAEFLAYSDGSIISAIKPWKIKELPIYFANKRLQAKWPKILPHLAAPGFEASIWIVASVSILPGTDLPSLLELALRGADIALFKHSQRNCLYEESWECLRRGLDKPEVIYNQICSYTEQDYPQNNGLHEATIIIRRHTPATEEFNKLWWQEVSSKSLRDQISFDYCSWKLGLPVNTLPGSVHRNKFFRKFSHLLRVVDKIGTQAGGWQKEFSLGQEAINQEDLQAALIHFLRATALQPDIFDVWLALATTMLSLATPADALKSITRALEIKPEEPGAVAILLKILRKLGMLEYALEAATLLIDLAPEDIDSYYDAAEISLALGRVDVAKSFHVEIVALESSSLRLCAIEYAIAAQTNQLSLDQLQEYNDADLPQLNFWRAYALFQAGQFGRAKLQFNNLLNSERSLSATPELILLGNEILDKSF